MWDLESVACDYGSGVKDEEELLGPGDNLQGEDGESLRPRLVAHPCFSVQCVVLRAEARQFVVVAAP